MPFILKFNDLEVGQLEFKNKKWIFAYTDAFRSQEKVKPIAGFSNINKTYQNKILWPFFAIRIPSSAQRSVQNFVLKTGINAINEVVLLKKFGRRVATNPFELIYKEF